MIDSMTICGVAGIDVAPARRDPLADFPRYTRTITIRRHDGSRLEITVSSIERDNLIVADASCNRDAMNTEDDPTDDMPPWEAIERGNAGTSPDPFEEMAISLAVNLPKMGVTNAQVLERLGYTDRNKQQEKHVCSNIERESDQS